MKGELQRTQRAALESSLRERAFRPLVPRDRPYIGAEAEFIPIDGETGAVCPIDGDTPVTSLRFLRLAAQSNGWRERVSAKGTPHFELGDGGTLGFEPGGQLEYSSPACATGSELLGRMRAVVAQLRQAADPLGVELVAVGIDPATPLSDAPLRLLTPRYRRMAEYFASIGPFGDRMMRQTASLQVSLDLGIETWRLWRVLNRMAPYVTAIFANSPRYAGFHTGHASYRAHCWRQLDPSRTGAREARGDAAADYCDFALAAPAMFLPQIDGAYTPMKAHLAAGTAGMAEWDDHLTTLFPEIRPRGTFEVRTCDAVAPEWFAAPLALLGGIAYDRAALRQADELLDGDEPALLARAGRAGLSDPAIAAIARDLAVLALDGCESIGASLLTAADLGTAREFFDRYTLAGRAPADDLRPVPSLS
ncbi:MAG TPA: glutamate-cysteine ligase family protein [Gemmatimonadaceae bacterium]|nr:glutamate-cysteine ligase family protein [Gemmatimonadaceae bacterium]